MDGTIALTESIKTFSGDMISFFVIVGVNDVVVKRCQIPREMSTLG